jgi:hypothetical protein
MTLIVKDHETRNLDLQECRAVAGGLGPVSGPASGVDVGQVAGQVGANSLVGSASSYGVLNTTLNLQLQVAPQVNVQTANIVDLTSITDLTHVLNSVIA